MGETDYRALGRRPAGVRDQSPASTFVTSDQCLGCHTAGGTGLQYEMTAAVPGSSTQLFNFSPYGTWRTSPMGLAGRDPILSVAISAIGVNWRKKVRKPSVSYTSAR